MPQWQVIVRQKISAADYNDFILFVFGRRAAPIMKNCSSYSPVRLCGATQRVAPSWKQSFITSLLASEWRRAPTKPTWKSHMQAGPILASSHPAGQSQPPPPPPHQAQRLHSQLHKTPSTTGCFATQLALPVAIATGGSRSLKWSRFCFLSRKMVQWPVRRLGWAPTGSEAPNNPIIRTRQSALSHTQPPSPICGPICHGRHPGRNRPNERPFLQAQSKKNTSQPKRSTPTKKGLVGNGIWTCKMKDEPESSRRLGCFLLGKKAAIHLRAFL